MPRRDEQMIMRWPPATGVVCVAVDPRYFRTAEVNLLIGDSSKAHKKRGWRREIGVEARIAERAAADRIAVGEEARRHDE